MLIPKPCITKKTFIESLKSRRSTKMCMITSQKNKNKKARRESMFHSRDNVSLKRCRCLNRLFFRAPYVLTWIENTVNSISIQLAKFALYLTLLTIS